MTLYSHWMLPYLIDLTMRQKRLAPFRQRVVRQAHGRVLEVGIGSGLNLPFYDRGADWVCGIDPSPELLGLARKRIREAGVATRLVRGSSEALPLEDQSVDTVVVTFALCTIPDVARALAEMRRTVKPDGELLFVEHGRAPEPRVANWQDRLTPLWRRVAGGCHLNRDVGELIRTAGFRLEQVRTGYLGTWTPRPMTFLYEGRARPV